MTGMNGARDDFLQRVRQAVAEGNRVGTAVALEPRGGAGYQGAGPDPVQRFSTELAAAGGHAHLVADAEAVAACIIELLQAAGSRRILVGRDPLLDSFALPERMRRHGFEVFMSDALADANRKEVLFAADAGVSGVRALVAETGTVVVETGPDHLRSLSLLPPLHIAVAAREQLLPDLFDLFASLEPPPGGTGSVRLPSCLTLITGPSKTGDIELRLVTGVHGPGQVHVVLLAERSLRE
jgi:L-lactate utilization protein LutC